MKIYVSALISIIALSACDPEYNTSSGAIPADAPAGPAEFNDSRTIYSGTTDQGDVYLSVSASYAEFFQGDSYNSFIAISPDFAGAPLNDFAVTYDAIYAYIGYRGEIPQSGNGTILLTADMDNMTLSGEDSVLFTFSADLIDGETFAETATVSSIDFASREVNIVPDSKVSDVGVMIGFNYESSAEEYTFAGVIYGPGGD